LLVLDEPTSMLDAESAETVQKSLREFDGSFVVVTHEREMMALADRVVLLEGGYVVEEGGFGELVRKGGRLAEILARNESLDGAGAGRR
jgi:ATP-binding cassette subfamily B (MDR/TAP) protein 1